MTASPADLLGGRAWRRLERSAIRAHERDLLHRLADLAFARTPILDATAASTPAGVMRLQLPGHRLVLGGVAPAAAVAVLATTRTSPSLRLIEAGRYGRLWWIEVAGDEQHVVSATHLQLLGDRGRRAQTEIDLPILSATY